MSFIRTEDKKKHHARKLPDGSFEFDGKKEEVGGGSSGSVVTWTNSTVSTPRKQIGTINIDGVETKVYAPNPSIPKYTPVIQINTVMDFIDSSHWDVRPTLGWLTSGLEKEKFCKSEVTIVCQDLMNINIVTDDVDNPLASYIMSDPGIMKLTLLKNKLDNYYTLYAEAILENGFGGGLLTDEVSGNIIISDLDIDKTYGPKTIPEASFVSWGNEDERVHYLYNFVEYYDINESSTAATADTGD